MSCEIAGYSPQEASLPPKNLEGELRQAHKKLLVAGGLCVGLTVLTCLHPAFAALALATYPLFIKRYSKFEGLQDKLGAINQVDLSKASQ